jgi:hypothetical protein
MLPYSYNKEITDPYFMFDLIKDLGCDGDIDSDYSTHYDSFDNYPEYVNDFTNEFGIVTGLLFTQPYSLVKSNGKFIDVDRMGKKIINDYVCWDRNDEVKMESFIRTIKSSASEIPKHRIDKIMADYYIITFSNIKNKLSVDFTDYENNFRNIEMVPEYAKRIIRNRISYFV